MANKRKIYAALALMLVAFLIYLRHEKHPPLQNPPLIPQEDVNSPPENWKEYDSLLKIWPQLKEEKIESIRFCEVISLEYGYDMESDFQRNVNKFGYRERAADVVRWWPSNFRVPQENLSECIEIIDKVINDPQWRPSRCGSFDKMLIVTGKGNYIFPEEDCMSDKLGNFLVKYGVPGNERWYFVPPKEQTVAIAIFSNRHPKDRLDSGIVWPPIALFGDKRLAEELMGRPFEPKMVFDGREWLEKIVDAYEIASKDAEKARDRKDDSSTPTSKHWIVFLTQDEFYWRGIGIDDDKVIGGYMVGSKQLKSYFDELDLTKELSAKEPNTAE